MPDPRPPLGVPFGTLGSHTCAALLFLSGVPTLPRLSTLRVRPHSAQLSFRASAAKDLIGQELACDCGRSRSALEQILHQHWAEPARPGWYMHDQEGGICMARRVVYGRGVSYGATAGQSTLRSSHPHAPGGRSASEDGGGGSPASPSHEGRLLRQTSDANLDVE